MDKRIFVRKREKYNQEELSLKASLNEELHLALGEISVYQVYDIYNITPEVFEIAKKSVFSEEMTDEVFDEIELKENHYFAYETLPAQYDQRADSAMQCIQLLSDSGDIIVRQGTVVCFNKALKKEEMEAIRSYLLNPIECREKDMTTLAFTPDTDIKPMYDLTGFTEYTEADLLNLKKRLSLALDIEDLKFIQNYFITEKRDPCETEIYVLDCYWSDHCRHTTFETVLDEITISSKLFQKEMQEAFDRYLSMRDELKRTKPVTLMDMASIVGRYHRNILNDQKIEVSEEINACSFFADIKNNGKEEKWLIQFKNETHNHPTEIEPFGGASTCIGGAIRDPLSGRSYVYQAMRITGCGNILEKRENTLPDKLPQSVISKKAAQGYSSYGNQIGLATGYVKELYDDSYVAKHMEVGAVVGAVKADNIKRETPVKGDMVIVIGGRTGRDGIQGASGSSVVHDNSSLHTMSSQVQKGNAIEERKLQRLFRNPEVSGLIKKCNDFGAGGVCVAIGELSDGIEIHLDKVPLKYKGLNPTEIAISESQERMAVVIAPGDYAFFAEACEKENIESAFVAEITDKRRLEMYYNDQKVVDLSADFLETSGVRQHRRSELIDNKGENPFIPKDFSKEFEEAVYHELGDMNVASQKGLVTRFDSSIGTTTVLMPFAGKHQMTPVQAGVQALPTLNTTSDTATVLSCGFIPKISHYSPFLSSIYAVLESLAKVYSVGGNRDNLYFSFQEYFEKLGDDPHKWGKVTQSLLGSIYAQLEIGNASIGGKDSMSGSFNEMNVVETLISFACAAVKIENIITPELKTIGNKLYFIPVVKDDRGFPNIKETVASYEKIRKYISEKKIVSAYVLEEGSAVSSLYKMAVGNDLGFDVQIKGALDFQPASMIVEAVSELDFEYIGQVSNSIRVNGKELDKGKMYSSYTSTFEPIYPIYQNTDKKSCENISNSAKKKFVYPDVVEEVKVVIPVFPGTNCEYDSARAFEKEGAKARFVLIRNKRPGDIEESAGEFAKAISDAHIIMFAGGFSSGDEPDGSAKFIVNFLKNEKVKTAVHKHLEQKKLILGICNGFQALIKSGLIPYGKIQDLSKRDLTLYHNDCRHHISRTAMTRVACTDSAWTQGFKINDIHEVVLSHGEGKLVGEAIEDFKHLAAFQYCDFEGNATMNGVFNPNGSLLAVEGMVSENGLILGKMGHSERYAEGLYKTRTIAAEQNIFRQGVQYFRGGV